MTSGDRSAARIGTGEFGAPKIIQTRDVTQAEARRMSRFAANAIFQEARRDPFFWIFKIVALGGMVAGFLIFVDFIETEAGASFPDSAP